MPSTVETGRWHTTLQEGARASTMRVGSQEAVSGHRSSVCKSSEAEETVRCWGWDNVLHRHHVPSQVVGSAGPALRQIGFLPAESAWRDQSCPSIRFLSFVFLCGCRSLCCSWICQPQPPGLAPGLPTWPYPGALECSQAFSALRVWPASSASCSLGSRLLVSPSASAPAPTVAGATTASPADARRPFPGEAKESSRLLGEPESGA